MLNIDERTLMEDDSMSKALPKEHLNKVSNGGFHTIAELFWSAKKVDQQQIVTTGDKIFKNLETLKNWLSKSPLLVNQLPQSVCFYLFFIFINPPQLDN